MGTTDDLQAAFAGESQANRKYLAFAKKAEKEGFSQVGKLFRAVARAETIHAHSHLNVLDGVQGTATNLKESMAGEHHEFTEMYPGFIATAKAEGNKKAIRSMTNAMEVEKVHHDLFGQALAAIESGKDLEGKSIYLCPVCGHVEFGTPPANCPVCNVKGEKYMTVS
jgi:rubrerythrin